MEPQFDLDRLVRLKDSQVRTRYCTMSVRILVPVPLLFSHPAEEILLTLLSMNGS